jgi:hypothetical protein
VAEDSPEAVQKFRAEVNVLQAAWLHCGYCVCVYVCYKGMHVASVFVKGLQHVGSRVTCL